MSPTWLYWPAAAGGVTAWTPNDLTVAPEFWFDAADINGLIDNDQLNTWINRGSNSNAGRDNSHSEPGYPRYRTNQLNGLPGIEWPTFSSSYGTRMFASDTMIGGNFQDVTVFVVARCTNPSGTRQVWFRTNHNELTSGRTASRWGAGYWNGGFSTQASSANFSTEQAYLLTGVWNKTNSTRTLRVNGSLQNTTSQATWTHNGNFSNLIGSNQYGTPSAFTQTFVGFIHEIVVLNQTFSNDEMLRVEGYLAHKWGLQGNLPVDHPYKNSPPAP